MLVDDGGTARSWMGEEIGDTKMVELQAKSRETLMILLGRRVREE